MAIFSFIAYTNR